MYPKMFKALNGILISGLRLVAVPNTNLSMSIFILLNVELISLQKTLRLNVLHIIIALVWKIVNFNMRSASGT